IQLSDKDFEIRLSSRKLLEALFSKFKIPPSKWTSTFMIFDKWEKISVEERIPLLRSIGLEETHITSLMEYSYPIHTLETLKEILGDTHEALLPLRKFMDLSEVYGYHPWIKLHPFTVRGLSYYTGIVFEIFDRFSTHRAVCGGGRYDTYLTMPNGKFIPAVGVGMGDIVLMEILKERRKFPFTSFSHLQTIADFTLWASHAQYYSAGLSLATRIRNLGWRVWMSPMESPSAKTVFRRAHRQGCAAVLILSDAYFQKSKKIQIRRLMDGYQMECTEERLPQILSLLSLSSSTIKKEK
ncbi:hypothetical protein IE077_003961, partial [Cardiosporidium cionae]